VIDHVGFDVSDYARSRAFYSQVLAPLGYGVVMEVTREMTGSYEGCGFGPPSRPHFWVGSGDGSGTSSRRLHVAFTAQSRAQVDAFHAAALAAGARDNGAPGLRLHYHPNYYGAFVVDPDGNNIEAVCHLPPDARP
jgi:catechol 2,3-dioxygenase-like lactoylglutathione lyase family enzyme